MYKIRKIAFTLTLLLATSFPALPAGRSLLSSSPAYAQSDSTITDNLKKRLQDTIATGSASLARPLCHSFVGQIIDVIKDTLVITDKDGKKNIKIASGSAVLRSPGNTPIKTENIRIEDYIIAIGKLESEDELESVRLIVSTNPVLTSTKISDSGTISKLGATSITLDSGDTLQTNKSTVFKSPLGTLIELSDLLVGDRIIYTAARDEDELSATAIMRIGFGSDSVDQ